MIHLKHNTNLKMRDLPIRVVLFCYLFSISPGLYSQDSGSDSITKASYQDGDVRAILAQNLTYPTEAFAQNIEGHVILQICISKDGDIIDAKFIESPDIILTNSCTEAFQIIKGKWNPAFTDGKPIDKTYRIVFSHMIYRGSPPPNYYKAAQKHIKREKYEKALKLYNKEIEFNPYDFELFQARSEIKSLLGDDEGAETDKIIANTLYQEIMCVVTITGISN